MNYEKIYVISKSERHFLFSNAVYLNNFDVKINSTQGRRHGKKKKAIQPKIEVLVLKIKKIILI